MIQLDYSHSEVSDVLNVPVYTVKNITRQYGIRVEHNMEFEEIAEVLGVSVCTVRRSYMSALEKIRTIINNDAVVMANFIDFLGDMDDVHLPPICFDEPTN